MLSSFSPDVKIYFGGFYMLIKVKICASCKHGQNESKLWRAHGNCDDEGAGD